jgi:hypothetical protein
LRFVLAPGHQAAAWECREYALFCTSSSLSAGVGRPVPIPMLR